MSSGLPNDFEPQAPAPAPGALGIPDDFGAPAPQRAIAPPAQTHSATTQPAFERLKNLWIQAGGDPGHADIMAHVGMAESGGDPNASNQYVDGGKTYHVRGLWQISDIHGPGNYTDPLVNARKAVELFNAQGLKPWEDSRNKGGGGGWGQYLSGAIVKAVAGRTPHDQMPVPDDFGPAPQPKPTPLPKGGFRQLLARRVPSKPESLFDPLASPAPQAVPNDFTQALHHAAHHGRAKNTDPTLARHDLLSTVAGHQDLPYILGNAVHMDALGGGGSTHRNEALHLWMTNPGAAMDKYGYNARPVLEFLAQHETGEAQAEAKYFLAHPKMAGADTFVAEFFNPLGWAEGAGVGKVLGYGSRVLGATEMGRRALHFASPYRELVAKFGTNARNYIAQMGSAITRRDEQAMQTVRQIFEGHNLPEKHEIVRLSQGLRPKIPNAPHLAKKAALLRQTLVAITREQLAANAIDPKHVFDTQRFFPMRGAYDHPVYNDQTMGFLDQLRPQVRSAGGTRPTTQHKVFATFDDSLQSPTFDPSKFDPAENLYRFLKARGANVEFENGLRALAKAHPDVVRQVQPADYGLPHAPWQQTATETERAALERTIAENNARFPVGHPRRLQLTPPTDRYGRQMIRAADALGADVASPFLKDAWISPEFADFLQRKGASTMTGTRIVDDAFTSGWGKIWDRYNGAMRAMIMQNPLYHPFWNIATNAAAAGSEHIGGWMKNYARAMIGTAFSIPELISHLGFKGVGDYLGAGRDVLERRFWTGAQTYARDVLAAERAGAGAEFGAGATALGGKSATIRTTPYKELPPVGKLDKFLTGLNDWNKAATFGPRGEQAFATTLFKKFTDPKGAYRMTDEDAAWSVREALGNYQNVNPDAVQSKLMFFYPWLKTNVPFWLKQFLTQPRYALAPMDAAHTANQLSGDPRAEDPNHPRSPNQTYLGTDNEGSQVAYTPPLPMKDAAKVTNIFDPRPPALGGPDVAERLSDGSQIVASRLMPVAGLAVDTLQTLAGKPADPGTYQGFDTTFNKAAPGDVQARQLALSALERLTPVPAPFLAQDIEKGGLQQDRLGDYAVELASLGFISRTDSDQVKRQSSRAMAKFLAQKKRLDKKMHGSHPLSHEEYQKKLSKAYGLYVKKTEQIREHVKKRLTGTTAAPTPSAPPDDFGPAPSPSSLPDDFGPPH